MVLFGFSSQASRVNILTNKVLDYFLLFCLLEVTYVFLDWMGAKFPSENVKNFFPNPAAFRERRECKIVRVDLPQTWNGRFDLFSCPRRWWTVSDKFGEITLNGEVQKLTIFCIVRSLVVSVVCKAGPFSFQCFCLKFCLKKINLQLDNYSVFKLVSVEKKYLL